MKVAEQHSFVGYLLHEGYQLKDRNRTFVQCPFCGGGDHTKLTKLKGKTQYYSHGCLEDQERQNGDIYDFLYKTKGLSYNLANKYLDNLNVSKVDVNKSQLINKPCDIDFTQFIEDQFILHGIHPYFVEDRKLSSAIVEKYKLTFIERGFKTVKDSIPEVKNGTSRLMQRYQFMLPIWDIDGKCRYFIARLNDQIAIEEEIPKTMNLRGFSSRIFNDRYIKNSSDKKYLFVVEGLFDALSIEDVGDHEAIGLNSTGNINLFLSLVEKHLEQVKDKHFVIIGDNDEPGRKAFNKLVNSLLKLGLNVKGSIVPGEKDTNEMLVNGREQLVSFIEELKEGKSMNSSVLEHEKTDSGTESAYQKKSLNNDKIIPIIRNNNISVNTNEWWEHSKNGKKLMRHVLAEHVMEKHHIVRYPNAHGNLYYYDTKKGIYICDKTGRETRKFILDIEIELTDKETSDTYRFVVDRSPIVNKTSNEFIGVGNGLLRLSNMSFSEFTPDVFLTFKIPTNYNSNAFDQFVKGTLDKVTDGYTPTIENIKEMFGTVLYPHIIVPKMFYLYGRSAHNGKSSILYLIHKTFNYDGGNISAISPQKLATNTFAGSSIYGKLANIVDDQPDQLIEDSGTLKTIITGGIIEIERKGKDSESVEMSTVCITASNFFPNFREHGNQINRRLHIMPFDHDFSNDSDCLPEIETYKLLSTESAREYVLKLAVDAIKNMLNRNGSSLLTPNEKSDEMGKQFAEYSDPLNDFFEEFSKEYFEEVKGTDALLAYNTWCHENFVTRPLGDKRFKESVCTKYNMEWKTKKLKINGSWKAVKGFKSK